MAESKKFGLRRDPGGWSYSLFPNFHIWKWGFGFGEGTNFEFQINHPNFWFILRWYWHRKIVNIDFIKKHE